MLDKPRLNEAYDARRSRGFNKDTTVVISAINIIEERK